MKTMRCIEISSFENGGELTLAERPIPEPQADEVLIKVAAAGVNRADLVQRIGMYPPPPGASDLLGLEVSGEVVQAGEQVTRWRVGDQVCALLAGGGYAEYTNAHQGVCLPIPAGTSLTEAGGVPETCFTVWDNVFMRGGLKQGENFLVHGGTSGIGTTAIQMAKAFGATVYTTAGSDAKCQQCLALGADRALNYRETDFAQEIKTLTDGRGADVILDMVGGDYVEKNISAAAPRGRIVSIAFLQGSKVTVDLIPVMLKQLVLTGSTIRSRPVEQKAAIAEQLREHVWPLFGSGQLKVVTAAEFPLDEADAAHQLMASSQHIGKIILRNS